MVVYFRNKLYDWNILDSKSFKIPTIAIGNIAVGGTGKTPVASYIINLLHQNNLDVGFVSRGYKRKSEGMVVADEKTLPLEIGDEPYQIFTKHPAIKLAVSKNRIPAIEKLVSKNSNLRAVVLDDALQHRKVKAGINILLTDYNNLYPKDYYLPAGELRDHKMRAKQVEIIVVTKCPTDLSEQKQTAIIDTLAIDLKFQKVFFSGIQYNRLSNIFSEEFLPLEKIKEAEKIILVTGIAKPQMLFNKISEYNKEITHFNYPDHHQFIAKEINQISEMFNNFVSQFTTLVLTTEKDAPRLLEYKKQLQSIPIRAVEIETYFIKDQQIFDNQILNYVREN